ncbi:MAG TPA: hypothetical protein VGN61_11900 [Verrucomicrobiae bacterium]|jgi:hypothetical protein
MTVADDQRSTEKLVLRALIISILLHFLLYFGYRIGQYEGWWANLAMPRWMQAAAKAIMPAIAKKPSEVVKPKEMQLVFVQTDPADKIAEAPKKPMFEGAHNTVAANARIVKPSDMPNIEGRQTKVLKTTEEELKPKAPPAQPVKPAPQEHPQVAVKPKPVQLKPLEHPLVAVKPVEPQKTYVPGDLAAVRPLEKPQDTATDTPTDTEAETPAQLHPNRPRTLGAVTHEGTAGEQTKSPGGVQHMKLTGSSLDVKGTVWGNYEEVMVDAIDAQWHQSLDNISWNASGKVVVNFKLYPDGHVDKVVIAENGVTDELATFCEEAIVKPSPFGAWPREMRLDIPADYLLLQFTFYYDLY